MIKPCEHAKHRHQTGLPLTLAKRMREEVGPDEEKAARKRQRHNDYRALVPGNGRTARADRPGKLDD